MTNRIDTNSSVFPDLLIIYHWNAAFKLFSPKKCKQYPYSLFIYFFPKRDHTACLECPKKLGPFASLSLTPTSNENMKWNHAMNLLYIVRLLAQTKSEGIVIICCSGNSFKDPHPNVWIRIDPIMEECCHIIYGVSCYYKR